MDSPEKSVPSETGEISNTGNKELSEARKRQLANLRPYPPGVSGNPSGRPKKKWLTEAVEQMLEQKLGDPKERQRFMDAQWEKMIQARVVGAMIMDKVWERTE